jgi:hypothetical protein
MELKQDMDRSRDTRFYPIKSHSLLDNGFIDIKNTIHNKIHFVL